ncbi:hypothetical protein [Bradyrhizobium sp. HKCCYLS20291]|uniref:hypothetical protein n=1 Tax=Bradyrhizobium sp. HKCCYLS20291 TaxID=3420766 RepID=UPI003EBC7359
MKHKRTKIAAVFGVYVILIAALIIVAVPSPWTDLIHFSVVGDLSRFLIVMAITISLCLTLIHVFGVTSSVLWKRSDYVYFVSAIIGSVLALFKAVEQQVDLLSGQLSVEHKVIAARASLLATMVVERCGRQESASQDDPTYQAVCELAHNQRVYNLEWDYAAKRKDFFQQALLLWNNVVPAMSKDGGDRFFLQYMFLSEVNKFDQWLSEEQHLDELAHSALPPLKTPKAIFPIFLGIALGVRLSRTHYDVLTEKMKERGKVAPTPATAEVPQEPSVPPS